MKRCTVKNVGGNTADAMLSIGKILEQFGIKADQMGISKGDVDVSGFVESQQSKTRSTDDNIVTLTRSGGRTIITENGVRRLTRWELVKVMLMYLVL